MTEAKENFKDKECDQKLGHRSNENSNQILRNQGDTEAESSNAATSQLADLHDAFNIFDKDRDGIITAAEIQLVMKDLGQNPTEAEIKRMIRDADNDNKGFVSFDEFVSLMQRKKSETDSEQEIKKVFQIFDKDKDGFIGPDELKQVMKCLGDNLTDNEVNEMIMEADVNEDGLVDFDEFRILIFNMKDS